MAKRRSSAPRQEIARNMALAVGDVLSIAKADMRRSIAFRDKVALVDPPERETRRNPFYDTGPFRPIEMHVLQFGEVSLARNPSRSPSTTGWA